MEKEKTNAFTTENYTLINKLKLYPLLPMFYNKKHPTVSRKDLNNRIDKERLMTIYSGQKQEWTTEYGSGKTYESKDKISGYCAVLGEPSGVMVIDLDVPEGHNADFNGIDEFEKAFGHPYTYFNTLKVKSPSGGVHMYFKYDPEFSQSMKDLLPNVDFLSNGYIAPLPGSYRGADRDDPNKPTGFYELDGYTEATEITLVPPQMIDTLRDLYKKKTGGKTSKKTKKSKPVNLNKGCIKEGSRNQDCFNLGVKLKNPVKNPEEFAGMLRYLFETLPETELPEAEINAIINSVTTFKKTVISKGGIVNMHELTQDFLSNNKAFRMGHCFYIYDKNRNAYEVNSDLDIQNLYMGLLDNLTGVKGSEYEVFKAEKFLKQLTVEAPKYKNIKTEFNEKMYVNCDNGIYSVADGTLLPHDSKYLLTSKAHSSFDPNYKDKFDNSDFKSFLDIVTKKCKDPETVIMLIQEMIGLVLSPHAQEVQKAFALLGEGANGKSILFHILYALVGGAENTASVGLERMSKKGFDLGELEGKAVNIDPDMEYKDSFFAESAKSVVAGDFVRIDKKYKDPETMDINITTIVGVNRLPAPTEKSKGVYRRLAIIPLNTKFGSLEELKEGKVDYIADRNFKKVLTNPAELSIILSWALDGLTRLYLNEWKLTESADCNQQIEDYRYESDSCLQFYSERLTKVDDLKQRIMVSDLYVQYCEFCDGYRIAKQSRNNFNSTIKAQGIEKRRFVKGMFWIGLVSNDDIFIEDLEDEIFKPI